MFVEFSYSSTSMLLVLLIVGVWLCTHAGYFANTPLALSAPQYTLSIENPVHVQRATRFKSVHNKSERTQERSNLLATPRDSPRLVTPIIKPTGV